MGHQMKKKVSKTKAKPKLQKKRPSRNVFVQALLKATSAYDRAIQDLKMHEARAQEIRASLPTLYKTMRSLQEQLGQVTDIAPPPMMIPTHVPVNVEVGEADEPPKLTRAYIAEMQKHGIKLDAQGLPELSPRIATGPPPPNFLQNAPKGVQDMVKMHPAVTQGNMTNTMGMVDNISLPESEEHGLVQLDPIDPREV